MKLLLLILVGALLLPAEPVHSLLPEPGRFKVSDGVVLHWNANAKDRSRDAIEAFDRNGARVFGINIYNFLPSAKIVSISDIAVRRNRSIAVAGADREKNNQIRSWLLQLGWDGRLTQMTELDAANEIGWLDFDESGNIWGLTDYLGERVRKDTIYNGVPCPLGPLILVFNPEGKIVRSILKQVNFPKGLQEAPAIGQVTFGLTNDKVWFWQPAKHRMIITDREGSSVWKISIPHARTYNLGGQTLLTPTGEVIQDRLAPTPSVNGIYLVSNSRIERFSRPQNVYLIGMDGSELVFVNQTRPTGDFLIKRTKSLAELQTMAKLVSLRNPLPE